MLSDSDLGWSYAACGCGWMTCVRVIVAGVYNGISRVDLALKVFVMRRSLHFKTIVTTLVTVFVLTLVGGASAQSQPASLFQQFQLHIREDAERVADTIFGEGERPLGWLGNFDLNAPNFTADLFVDNEQLADAVFGSGVRPPEWFGATTLNLELMARNLRHDVELSADEVFGLRNRPQGWRGARAIFRCDRTLQNLTRLLETFYRVRSTTIDEVLNYCVVLKAEIEEELFNQVFRMLQDQEQAPLLLSGVRGDLERLADELLGLETRPSNWVGNRDETTPTFLTDLYVDMERLADDRLGANVRPPGWVRRVVNTPSIANQNLRFNLESLTDLTLGGGRRPTGWQGVDPLTRCDTSLQNLIAILQRQYPFAPLELPAGVADTATYCAAVARVANDQAENPPAPPPDLEVEAEQPADLRYRGKSRYAFAYLDVAALQYMGVMPFDTEFRAWFRNFNESNMMFVSGENFALFIDRRFTTLDENLFRTLPTLEGRRPLTFCDASWCNGPGPTPTPTGSGPIIALFEAATPPATVSPQTLEEQGKRLVSWNNIRVGYLLDRPETRSVQVTLEVCADTQQIACEPAIRVFNAASGIDLPVIQTFNGLNVYELNYGYSTNLIIESANLFSRDVFISDPTIRSS